MPVDDRRSISHGGAHLRLSPGKPARQKTLRLCVSALKHRSTRQSPRATVIRKGIYLLIGFLLIPSCLGVAYSTLGQIIHSGDFRQTIVFFFIGFASYLTFFIAFRKPLRAYIIGHELTHALWVFLFRGKVREIRLSKQRGQIKATKSNTLIALAPYFFPLYTIALMAAYSLASIWMNFGNYYRLVVAALGFTWSFHLLLNIFIIQRGQEDLRISGSFFSLVLIFLFNVIIFGLIMCFVSEGVTLKSYLSQLTKDVVSFYTAIFRVVNSASWRR